GRRMSDEAKQTHEREKRLTRDLARTKCAVQLEGCERARCCGQAKARVDAVELDSDEGIEERKGARDVPPRAQRLDESNLSERRLQLRRTDLPLDALGQSHQRATLAILLCAACRSVLRQASPEIARLADVDQRAGGVVHAIDARPARNSGEKFRAEFPVDGPHAP